MFFNSFLGWHVAELVQYLGFNTWVSVFGILKLRFQPLGAWNQKKKIVFGMGWQSPEEISPN